MSRRRDLLVLLLFLVIFFLFIYALFGVMTPSDSFTTTGLGGGEKVALIRLIGPIYDSRPILEQLKDVEEATSVKALVLRLETPGGAVAASQEIYEKLAYLRDELEIPIIASMGNIAASGGYYISLGADSIIANAGSITGSIGVIMILPEYYDLMDKIGIGQKIIKSGKFKDAGTPYRKMTTSEEAYLQDFIDDGYDQFVSAVAEERGMSVEDVRAVADGRIYTGRQALELGLIDLLGGLDDAIQLAGQLGGIDGPPDVVELEKRRKLTLLDLLLEDFGEILYSRLGWNNPFRFEMPR